MVTSPQERHYEWYDQWSRFDDDTEFLFFDWIYPRTLEDFRGKTVMDAGCGPGHHVRLVAPVARHVTGVDLNTASIAKERLAEFDNVTLLEADIARFQPDNPFEVVYCIGVIHHTDDPEATFENLKRCVRPGGLLIIWCYSKEGNGLVQVLVEPARKLVLRRLPRAVLLGLAWLLTGLMYPLVYTLYRLPLRGLPFYEYFENFRRLSFRRNMLNVFDKLNAPQTQFISHERVTKWFRDGFEDVSITPYKGVSWRASGRRAK